MKSMLRSIAAALCVLAAVVTVLCVTQTKAVSANGKPTQLRVKVQSVDGAAVDEATVRVGNVSVTTDVTGCANIVPTELENRYDAAEKSWYTADIVVVKKGYTPTVVVGCVFYEGKTRKITVRIYADDGSDLPVVTYVESPPSDYINRLVSDTSSN